MEEEVLKRCITKTHFRGVPFYDISPLMLDPQRLRYICEQIAQWAKSLKPKPQLVVGLDARGFLFGPIVALELGIGFAMIRKAGKLPPPTVGITFTKEYGDDTIEMSLGAIEEGASVLILDDLLATGGTAVAAAELVRKNDGIISGFAFVIELNHIGGRSKLSAKFPQSDIYAGVTYNE